MNSSSITINGISHRTLGNKLSNSDFTKNMKDHDLIFLVETWSNQTDSIPGFKAISTCTATPKTNSSCRISGGITLLIKNTLQPLIYTEKLTKKWCRINKSILDSPHDLFICGVYIPPEKSPYYDVEIFKDLENDIAEFSTKGNIMLIGVFNARTSKLEDFVSKEGSTFIGDITETSYTPKNREKFDSTVNNHGKCLIELCKTCNLRVLNGRTLGDSFGKPTFHGKNGTSLADYIICDQDLIQNIKHFTVKPPTYLSDHSQILTWIRTKQQNTPESTHPTPTNTSTPTISHKLPLQFIWGINTATTFKENLKSTYTQRKLDELINSNPPATKEGLNTFLVNFKK